MSEARIYLDAQVQVRRDTEANWAAVDPVLCDGEIAYSRDINRIKIGDGAHKWSELKYMLSIDLSEYYTMEEVDNLIKEIRKITDHFFYDETNSAVATNKNFYSTGTVASGGVGVEGEGGGGGMGTVTGIIFAGSPNNPYEPEDGIITLPAYPKYLSELANDLNFVTYDALDGYNYATKNDLSKYLPLSGGTMERGAGIYSPLDSVYGAIGFNADHNAFGSPNVPTKIRSSVDPVYLNNSGVYTLLHSGNSSVSKSGQTLTVKINGVEQSITNSTYTTLPNPYNISFKDTSNKIVNYNGSSALDLTSGIYYAYLSNVANTVLGNYTSNGGQQNPNYFGSYRVGFLMMNTTVNSNGQFKDWIIMDCYGGNDVGGGVAFGVNRQKLGAYIMRSKAERTSWAESAELIGTHNYTDYTVKKDGTGANGTWDINITGNAASATKLQTARTIWGQSFDGTGNVGGSLTGTNFLLKDRTSNPYLKFTESGLNGFIQFVGGAVAIGPTYTNSLLVNNNGNVLIGATTDSGYKLDVSGTARISGAVAMSSTLSVADVITANGGVYIPSGKNLLIGSLPITWDESAKALRFEGSIYATGTVASGGVGEEGETNMLISWNDYVSDADAKLIPLSAYLGKYLYDNKLGKSDNAASATKLSDNTAYTAWGRTFFQNGKPVNVTSSPIVNNNGGLYIKDTNENNILAVYLDTNNILHLGRGAGNYGYNTKIQGKPVILYHGMADNVSYTMQTLSDGIQIRQGLTLKLGTLVLSTNASGTILYVNGNAVQTS